MRTIAAAMLMALTTTAHAQSGFFAGGMADGAAEAQRLELQRRAIEADARHGTNNYYQLRNQQQMDELIRQNHELLEIQRRRLLLNQR